MLLLKSDISHHTASFVVLVPDAVDNNGDSISADEIVKTSHDFMQNLPEKGVNLHHHNSDVSPDIAIVESFLTPVEIPVGETSIPVGSWIVALKFLSDTLWEDFTGGKFTGVSMEGHWTPPVS